MNIQPDKKRAYILNAFRSSASCTGNTFDATTRLAAHISNCPVSLLTLDLDHFLKFRSRFELDFEDFVQFLSPTEDETKPLRNAPIIVDEPEMVFHKTFPLISEEGASIGTLSVLNSKQIRLDKSQVDALTLLAKQAVELLELQEPSAIHSKNKKGNTSATLEKGSEVVNEKYQLIFNANPLPMWIYDIENGGILDANQTALEKYGYSRKEFLELTIEKFRPETELPELWKAAKGIRALKGTKRFGVFTHQKKSGEQMRMDVSGHRLTVQGREGLLVICNDVTQSEKDFRVLQANEARYRGFYDSQTNFVIRTDMEGNYSYINKKFQSDFGWLYPDGNILGKNSLSSILERDHQKVMETVTLCAHSPGEVYKVEIAKPAQSGGHVTTLWDFVCIADLEGIPQEIQCMGIDISDRINFEQELKASNERYDLVNQATNDAIYDWDVENDVFYWGEGFYRTFGYPKNRSKILLSDWFRLTHPADAEEQRKRWDDFIKDGSAQTWTHNFRFRQKDNSYAYVEEIGTMLRDELGNPKRMIGALRDVSETKEAERQKEIQHQLTNFFNEDQKLEDILNRTLEFLADNNYHTGEIWLSSNDKTHLNLISTHATTSAGKKMYAHSKSLRKIPIDTGLPGGVMKNPKVTIWNKLQNHPEFIRSEAFQKAGLESATGIPLFHNTEAVGVLIFCGDSSAEPIATDHQHLEQIGKLLGAEIKRKQQEEEFTLLFESAPEILVCGSPNGHFEKVNPAFCQLLGYTSKELTEQPFENFLHPADHDSTLKIYNKAKIGKGISGGFVNRYRAKDGNYHWISWNTSDSFGEDGLFFAYGRDITEMKELQDLFENSAQLARIGSWEVDLQKDRLFWSDVTKSIHELPPDFVPDLETALKFYTPGQMRDEINKVFEAAINNGTAWDRELIISTAKGNNRWVRSIGRPEFRDDQCVKVHGSFQDIHQRKIAELALQKAYEERNNILESIGDGFFTVDEHFTVTYWNHQAEVLLETPREQIIGQNLWEMFDDAPDGPSVIHYNEVIKEQQVRNFEDYYAPVKRWFEISAYPLDSGLSVYFKDITERKKAEADLQIKTKQLDAIANINTRLLNYADWLKVIDTSFTQIAEVVDADRVYYFKNSQNEATGEQFSSQVLEWSRDSVEPQIENPELQDVPFEFLREFFEPMIQNKPFQGLVADLKNPDLKAMLIEQDIKALLCLPITVDKKFWGFIGFDDCTNERIWSPEEVTFLHTITTNLATAIATYETSEELKTAYTERSNILESIGDAFFAVDRDWTVTYWNKQAEKVLGIQRDDIVGKILWDVYDTHVSKFHAAYLKAMKTGKVMHFEEYYASTNSWFEVSAYPSDKGLSVYFKDVSIRKVAEEQIRESNIRFEKLNVELAKHAKDLELSNAELEQFAYVASHDLQEPLRMVTSFLTQLERKYEHQLDEKAQQYIYYAVDGAKRMRQIILDLLEFSRVGRIEEDKTTFDLNQLINDYCTLRQTTIEEKSAKISYSELPQITNYKAPITQVFHNLLDNGLKYVRDGVPPQISIEAIESEKHWEFSVKDNGIGIDEEYFTKIFVIFQRLHEKSEFSGSGMGLAIVKKIIENLGGKIWLQSTPERGSTFFFTLPK